MALTLHQKTDEQLQKELNESARPVCGIFNKSQLSNQFLKYAAATFVATSLVMPTFGHAVIKQNVTMPGEKDTEWQLLGIVQQEAEPIGGLESLLKRIAINLIYPNGLSTKGKVVVEVTVDAGGKMENVARSKKRNSSEDQNSYSGMV